jgi:hypothetical protein
VRVRRGVAAGRLQAHHQCGTRLRGAVVIGLRVLGGSDQCADLVIALQQQRAQLRRQCDAAFAQPVEQGLDVVGEGHDLVESEDARRALDRVRAAEQRAQQLAVVRRVLELQQQLLQHLDLFLRFADEGGQRFHDEAVVLVLLLLHAASPSASVVDRGTGNPSAAQASASTGLALRNCSARCADASERDSATSSCTPAASI